VIRGGEVGLAGGEAKMSVEASVQLVE